MPEKVFLNDNLIEVEEARVGATDSGLLYGAGLFETMRSRNGVVFRLGDHLDRLFASARALSIACPSDPAQIRTAIDQVLQANQLADARLRLTLTNGPLATGQQERRPTLLITATAFQPYPAEYYQMGVLVILCPFRQNITDPTCGHKTTSYYPRLLALNLAHQNRAAEALWFTTDHRLAEGCVSNVFLVKGSALYTPALETPVLPGIARKAIRRGPAAIARADGERPLHRGCAGGRRDLPDQCRHGGAAGRQRGEKHTVGEGKVGPVTKRLREGFLEAVEQQCRRQE